jgi:hypothetical protein
MRKVLTAAFLVLICAAGTNANTGYFTGSGHTITLTKTEQVQLVSEDVTITPRCGWTPQMDAVDYRCKFVLKNLTAKPLKIQVGFPLDSQFAQQAKGVSSAARLVLNYHFIARDDKNTYHTRFVAGDSQKRFSRLFLWDMAFDPAETKVLDVAYQLGMSLVETSTRKQPTLFPGLATPQHAKKWHAGLEVCWVEHFHYITETGKSWAAPIEHASFRVQTGYLEDCLAQRPLMDVEPPEPRLDQQPVEYDFPLKAGAIYSRITPDGWTDSQSEAQSEEDFYRNAPCAARLWEYRNYKAGEPLCFAYYMVAFPRADNDCDCWVRHILGRRPGKADLAELREITAAFYGIAPHSESAAKFAKQQVWYHPQDGLQESKLSARQRAVLEQLDAIAQGSH